MLGLFYSATGKAEPVFVFASEIRALLGTSRSQLVAIYNQGTPEAPDFRMARPAVVPVGKDGKIIWFDNESWRRRGLETLDRVIIEQDMLGQTAAKVHVFAGCLPRRGERLEVAGRVVWLASCDQGVVDKISTKASRVIYDPQAATVASSLYSYKFKASNHMLFERVAISGKTPKVIVTDSDLYIRSDIKNFFTLNFNSGDIESKIEERRGESLSQLASVGFYLRVLFFKLTLDLRTDVAFFESSANIPMVMTLPVNASKRLNRKSGVLYSFKVDDAIDLSAIRPSMPTLTPSNIEGDIAAAGLLACGALSEQACEYRLEIPAEQKRLLLQINIDPVLVRRGMFPWFVPDVKALQNDMKWSLPSSLDLKNRVGLYFEVSGLPKGSHPWDFWISFK